MLSAAVSFTVTSQLCQPLGAKAVVDGSWRSILMPPTVAPVGLPALSLIDAPTDRSSASPVMVALAGTLPRMPDSASLAVHLTLTSPLYQPAAFGPVVGAPLSVGAVLSTLIPEMANGSLPLSAASVAVP